MKKKEKKNQYLKGENRISKKQKKKKVIEKRIKTNERKNERIKATLQKFYIAFCIFQK